MSIDPKPGCKLHNSTDILVYKTLTQKSLVHLILVPNRLNKPVTNVQNAWISPI